jgi:hypothetical protein
MASSSPNTIPYHLPLYLDLAKDRVYYNLKLPFYFHNKSTSTMADNDDDLVDYDEEEVREGNKSFIGRAE